MIQTSELMQRLTEQAERKRDMIAPAKAMTIAQPDTDLTPLLRIDRTHSPERTAMPLDMPLTDDAHRQLASFLGIDKRYYDRMRTQKPDLLMTNCNAWLADAAERGERRMLRALRNDDGTFDVRAVLSPRYMRIDHADILRESRPLLEQIGAKPFRAHLNDRTMHVTFVSEQLIADLNAGDPLHTVYRYAAGDDARIGGASDYQPREHKLIGALTLRNSETGHAGITVSQSVVVAACNNLCIIEKTLNKVHIGRIIKGTGDLDDVFSDSTYAAEARAVLLYVADMIRATFDADRFKKMVERMNGLRETRVDQPTQTIKMLAEYTRTSEDVLLDAFFSEPEPTAFGIHQAVTLAAQRVDDDEKQIELSKFAGEMVEASPSVLRRLLKTNGKTKGSNAWARA